MEPKKYIAQNLEQIHSFFRGFRPHPPTGWWFRGQSDANWQLVPKAGRAEYFLPNNRDHGRFNNWTKQATAYLSTLPDNDLERLALAQHHGLATCLLDWSFNPLVGLYFSCSDLLDQDGAVYCYDPPAYVDASVLQLKDLTCNGVGFVPRALAGRILNQRAAFTVHIPANLPLEVSESVALPDHPNLNKLTIPSSLKIEVLKMLDDYGINRVTLFPDLDGLSAHVNWETHKMTR